MKNEERYQITSNDYTDLLINHKGDESAFHNFPSGLVNTIDNNYAVLHIPVENLTVDSISRYGYTSIPCLYSLQTSPSQTYMPREENIITPLHDTLSGQGVLLGIVDTGINYMSPLFQTPLNTTRILSIWDQSIPSIDQYPKNFYYGTEYNSNDINLALASPSPLDIVPSTDHIGHGTMLASIASASSNQELSYSGIAPECDLVVVKLKEAKDNLKNFYCIPSKSLAFQENDIMMGVSYLLQYATELKRPISILIGVGTSQGDHGGRGYLSTMLSYYSIYPGIAFSIPAGNEGNRDHHYYGELLSTNNERSISMNVAPNEYGMLIELYSVPPSNLWVDIISPHNESIGKFNPSLGGSKTVQIFYKDTIIVVNNYIREDYTTLEQLVVIRFRNPIPGIWKIVVSSESDLTASFHLWLPVEAFIERGTYFYDANNNTTITSPGNSDKPITCTAYAEDTNTLYYYASKGNTVLNAPKPDITAPGVNIIVPINEFYSYTSSGTSLATAYVSGIVTLLLQWGIINGNEINFNGVQIKKALTLGAIRKPDLDYPNPDWGFGVINVEKTFKSLAQDLGGLPLY